MQNKVTPLTKALMTLIFIIVLLITKSIYLLLGIMILELILILKSNKNIHIYLNQFNNYKLIYLVLCIIYILIQNNYAFLTILFSIYKLLLVFILITIYIVNTNFYDLNEVIYKSLFFIKNKDKRFYISRQIVLPIVFMYNIFNIRDMKLSDRIGLSYYLTNKHEELLKLTYYSVKEKENNKTKILLVLGIIILISVIIKEVIL